MVPVFPAVVFVIRYVLKVVVEKPSDPTVQVEGLGPADGQLNDTIIVCFCVCVCVCVFLNPG